MFTWGPQQELLTLLEAILSDGPAGYWRLGESSGATASNRIVSGPSGSIVGGVTLGQPSLDASSQDTAARLNGSTGYISIGSAASYAYSRNFSVVLLFMRHSSSSSGALISKGRFGYYLRANAGGVEFLQSQTVSIGSAPYPISVNAPTIVGLTVSAGATATWRIYINGQLRASGTTSVSFASPAAPLLLGVDFFNAPNTEFGGYVLDEVAVFDKELSSERMLEYANMALSKAFDPLFSNVVLLLHGDGADGSTSFVDSSGNPKTVTVSGGSPVISAAESRFGGSSIRLPANFSHLSLPAADFQFPAGSAFTVELFIRLVALPAAAATIVAMGAPGAGQANAPARAGWSVVVTSSGAIRIAIGDLGVTPYNAATTTTNISMGVWTHVAVSVSGSAAPQIFLNGIQQATSLFSATNNWSTVNPTEVDSLNFFIGNYDIRFGSTEGLNAFIDELRITRGVARYTSNFTPPSEPFPDVGPPVVDPLFANVSLLLHLDGANGATVFTDSGPLNKTVTHSGGAVISTAQSRFGGASLLLDGDNDWLAIANPAGLNLQSVDFCVEGWARLTVTSGGQTLFDFRGVGAFNVSWAIFTDAANRWAGIYDGPSNTVVALTPTNSLPAANGPFFHWAVTRSGTTTRFFIDGVNLAQITYNPPATHSSGVLIGANHAGQNDFAGHMDEVRITRGHARYVANFTPPSEPFPDVGPPGVDPLFANVSLLLRGDGANGSTTILDSSVFTRAVSSGGGAAISTAQSRFGGSSVFFDGVDDYLSVANNAGLSLNGVDFAVEGFARWAAGTSFQTLIDFRGSGAFNSSWAIGIDTGNRTLFVFNGVSNATIASTAANSLPAAATWFHWAVTRAGTTLRLFIDGALGATVTFNPPATSATGIRIGINHDLSGDFSGFMDELRITNGAARYTANFTPPSEPFPDVGPPGVDPLFASVLLLMRFDGVNGSQAFVDSSSYNRTINRNGAQVSISSTQSVFGGTSGLFGGAELSAGGGAELSIGTADFCIEAFVYPTGGAGQPRNIVSKFFPTFPSGLDFVFEIASDGRLSFLAGTGIQISIQSNSAVPLNEWSHVAVSRSSGVTRLFVRGVTQSSTHTGSVAIQNNRNSLWIGSNGYSGNFFIGHIDELRITNGFARYVTNFTPPTAQLPGGGP